MVRKGSNKGLRNANRAKNLLTIWHEGGKTTEENCQMLCKECRGNRGDKFIKI